MNKMSDKRKAFLEEKKKETLKQFDMFMDIWKKRPHKSEISGKYLGNEALSTLFHHILPKERYPLAKFDEENIILLTFDEHQKAENDPYFYKEINIRREKLKLKYD